jgi:hypothetical protein
MAMPPRIRFPQALVGVFVIIPGLLLPPSVFGQTAQHALGGGVQFQRYSFNEALGAGAASLTLIPLAYTLPVGRSFDLEFYSAYAKGSVEKGGYAYTLQGPVDTRLRARVQLSPWAVFTALVNIPTGKSTHDEEEAVVASVLSTDILGFQEANWGTGTGVTAGLATAHQSGVWGIGFGASYRLSTGFEPTEGSDLTFEPGDEIRLRLGVDRSVGETGKFTAGVTAQNFSEDQYDGRNLFQAGNRLRLDASYAFRSGRSTWAFYAVDVWREAGDAFMDLVNPDGDIVGDTTLVVGSQNLLILGVNGSTPLGATVRIRPSLDVRYQTRAEGNGEGWIIGAGGDLPLRAFGSLDMFPRGKLLFGSLSDVSGVSQGLWGVELGLTIRWRG